jgi:hypothetical protein
MLFFELIAVFLFDVPYNGHYGLEYAITFYLNLSNQTHIETDNFIIEVPKFSWYKRSKDQNYFIGLSEEINNSRYLPSIGHVDLSDSNCSLDIVFPVLCKTPPRYFEETINSWEAEIYECQSKEDNNKTERFIKYKCECFWLSDLDILRPQYDTFFKGVLLKDQNASNHNAIAPR